LDGITLALVAEATSDTPVDCHYLRVFRNPTYPFVVFFDPSPDSPLYVWHRTDYVQGTLSYLAPPSGARWRSVDLDHDNGVLYALGTTPGGDSGDKVFAIQLDTDGTIADFELDGTHTNCPDADNIVFDADTDQVIVGSTANNKVSFWDATNLLAGAGGHLNNMTATLDAGKTKSAWRSGVQNGYLYNHVAPNIVQRIDVNAYSSDASWTLDESGVAWDGGACYDPLTHSMVIGVTIDGAPRFIKVFLDRAGSTTVNLSTIVEDICEDVGLDPATELDVTDLTDTTYGFVANDQMRARAALQVLMDAHLFDAVESDGKIKFVKRGGSPALNIPQVDLGAYVDGSEPSYRMVTTRQEELELPIEVRVSYLDPATNYMVGIQRERRLVTQSDQSMHVRLSVVMTADNAKRLCVKHLLMVWMQRVRHEIMVSREYMYLEPSDVITVTNGGVARSVRIEQMSYGPGTIKLKLVDDDPSVYESEAEGADLPSAPDDNVEYPGVTELAIIDVPLVHTSAITPGVYVAVTGFTDDWKGATVLRSPPLGSV
jgi:hypothetical protein